MEHNTPKKSFFETYQLFFAVIICGIFIAAGIVIAKTLPGQGGGSQPEAVQTETSVRKDLIKAAKKVGVNKEEFAVCLDTQKTTARISAAVTLAEKSAVTGTPTFFIIKGNKQWKIVGARDEATYLKSIEEEKPPVDQPPQPVGEKIVLTPTDHYRGPKDAKIVIVEYLDIDCIFCKKANPVIAKILNDHPEFAIVYRHSPIASLHPFAEYKAAASECVADLGGEESFWKFINLVSN